MKRILFFILLPFIIKAQQTTQFSQYTLNKLGNNPAAAGVSLKTPIEFIMGQRTQWLGTGNGPKTGFLGINYTRIPKRSYKRWHNFGVYFEQDNAGAINSTSIFLSYAVHRRISSKLNASVGIFGGVRNYNVGLNSSQLSDPVVQKTNAQNGVWLMPDIYPGIRVYNRKSFYDLSVRQLSTPKIKRASKQIGGPSVLTPHIYFSAGRKIYYDRGFCFIPSMQVHGAFGKLPSIEGNLMINYRSFISVGAGMRNIDFAIFMLQARVFTNAVFGIAFDYSINRYNTVAPRTLEFMIGWTPYFDFKETDMKRHVSACPQFDY